ncbi:MAG: tetratricopeptide repeat protein [Acidobacteriota bacterium]
MKQIIKLKKGKKILFSFFLIGMSSLVLFSSLFSQQTAGELFQEALFLEEAEGELRKALELYQKILNQFPKERETAVKAQLHIGLCYEKLGLEEAREAFERVIEKFPDQEEEVKLARQKLDRLLEAKAVIEDTKTELTMHKVFTGVNKDFVGSPSPDGRHISTVDWTTGDLAVKEIHSSKLRRLTDKGSWKESPEYALVSIWSPDGKKLAYSWMNKKGFFELRVIDFKGENSRILYRNKEYFWVTPYDWSPDGNYILAGMGKIKKTTQLAMISAADGRIQILKQNRVYPGFFLPDSETIIYSFISETSGSRGNDIALLETKSGEQSILVEHPAHDVPLVWDAQGERLFFISDRTGDRDIWALEMNQGQPKEKPYLLKKDIGNISPLGFTDDKDLYYVHYAGMHDVYTAALDPKTDSFSKPVEKATKFFVGANKSPDFSLDGKNLAYISERSYSPGRFPQPVICIQSLESGKTRELVPEFEYMRFIRWSADGNYFYCFGLDWKGRKGLYSIDARTGDFTYLKEFKEGEFIAELDVFPDGKKIVYKKWDSGGREKAPAMSLRIRNIQSGKEKEIYRRENASQTHLLALSWDGKWVAFNDRDPEKTINVIPTSGGEPKELIRRAPEYNILSLEWKPGSHEIYFIKGGELNQLWSLSLENPKPQKEDLSMRSMREMCFHPGGILIAFKAGYLEAELWVMENLLLLKKGKELFK